jgi:hypothetical protein
MITAPQKRDYEKLLASMLVLQAEVKARGSSGGVRRVC